MLVISLFFQKTWPVWFLIFSFITIIVHVVLQFYFQLMCMSKVFLFFFLGMVFVYFFFPLNIPTVLLPLPVAVFFCFCFSQLVTLVWHDQKYFAALVYVFSPCLIWPKNVGPVKLFKLCSFHADKLKHLQEELDSEKNRRDSSRHGGLTAKSKGKNTTFWE